ncbi:hypothetical protein [Novosphingobium olei]|uniref:hypothetical protein n=1 Tax=Novosphingobium olei TaxID=2728851 RepID=UPI00308E7105|nr:hypothetical protein NSDW_11890 [Novosphingobium olei]
MQWADLESALDAPPRFFVQEPDGVRTWSEDERCRTFVTLLHRGKRGPINFHHIKNEGRYNHALAKRIGVYAGVMDYRIDAERPLSAILEFKGYDRRGRPGKLSQAQIDYGNSMLDMGWLVACYFDPYDAFDWLRRNGFPLAKLERAA